MKKILLAVMALLLITGVTWSQKTTALALSKAYANSQADTALFPANTCHYWAFSLTYTVRDTAAADVYIDTKPKGQATASWTNVYSDSVIYASTGANYVKEILIRSNTLARAPGQNVDIRVRTAFRASANGVTTPTYDNILIADN